MMRIRYRRSPVAAIVAPRAVYDRADSENSLNFAYPDNIITIVLTAGCQPL